jgi:hypothetical protein
MANKNRQKAQRMASRGASAQQIRQATSIKAPAARNIVARASAPSPGPYNATNAPISTAPPTAGPLASGYVPLPNSPTPARTTPQIKGLGQGLRIAGGGYGISKSELDTLVGTKTDPGKIIQRLDKINANLAKKDKTGISLKSGAANKLIRKASKAALDPFGRGIDFGTGRIGLQIQSMLGDPGSPGYMRQGQRIGGRAAVAPTFLAKGMDLGPKGREQVRGIGKQYEVPDRLLNGDVPPPEEASSEEAPIAPIGPIGPIIPEEEEEVEVDKSLSSGAGGLDLASWATGFRRARSSRQKAGRGAQGLASQKKSPFTSWYK